VRDLVSLSRLHREPPPLVLECEQRGTYDDVPVVDRAVGRMLSVLVHCMQANRILEVGTGYGCATLWMALALPPAGKISTIDPDAERTRIAASYLQRAGVADAVEMVMQPALEVLPSLYLRNCDIAYLDADESEYDEILELCVPMLKRSGLVLVNGLLAGGEEARPFARQFLNHPKLDATILPIGDGLGIGARID
jgi:predicted O-methyltransferase YrrM